MLYMRVMYVEGAGGWFAWSGDISQEVVPEIAKRGHPVDSYVPFRRLGVAGGGAGCGLGHVGLAVAGAALGIHPPRHGVSDKVSPPVDGGHQDSASRGGRALAVRGGERGAVVSGDVEEGVEEEVSDARPQGGRVDNSGRPDALDGAGGVEA